MRLNAYLARSGVTSRRKAGELIKSGRVTVAGKPGQLNTEITPGNEVRLDGKLISLQKPRYILLYKPVGYVSTLKDPKNRRKVVDLLDISERVVPVGRLDYNTTGVLLLTNDGELAHRLMHPSFGVDKVYEATIEGEITAEKLRQLEKGVKLETGKTAPAKATKIDSNKVELTIHEGRKHQVKKMLSVIDLRVIKLHRSAYASLVLVNLKPGQWRDLSEDEVNTLKRYTQKSEKAG